MPGWGLCRVWLFPLTLKSLKLAPKLSLPMFSRSTSSASPALPVTGSVLCPSRSSVPWYSCRHRVSAAPQPHHHTRCQHTIPLPSPPRASTRLPPRGHKWDIGVPLGGSVGLSAPCLSPRSWPSTSLPKAPHLLQHHVAAVADTVGRSAQWGWGRDVVGQLRVVQHEAVGLQGSTDRGRGLP